MGNPKKWFCSSCRFDNFTILRNGELLIIQCGLCLSFLDIPSFELGGIQYDSVVNQPSPEDLVQKAKARGSRLAKTIKLSATDKLVVNGEQWFVREG